MDKYYGKYLKASAVNKDQAAKLLNSDNIIGDCYEIVCQNQKNSHVAYLKNRFGDCPCFFNEADSRQLSINEQAGLTNFALLSLVGFSEGNEHSNYWAEFCVVSLPKNFANFERVKGLLQQLFKSGKRPSVDLDLKQVNELKNVDSQWVTTNVEPLPKKQKGTVFLKTKVSFHDKMIEQARRRNIGCMAAGWVFLLAIVALVVFLVMKIIGA